MEKNVTINVNEDTFFSDDDMPGQKIIYGVDVFPNEKENGSLKALLKQPFQPYQKPTTDR